MGKDAALVLSLSLLVAVVMLPGVQSCRDAPSRDSGGALYAGWRILNGDILYRDVWDHKSPAIYFLNALGLMIGGGSVWGVLSLEFLSLLCAAAGCFILIREVFGDTPAFFAAAVWMLSLILVRDGGNLPEEYALPFQFCALLLFVRSEKRGWHPWRGLLIGLAFGIAFLLRQNLTGIWLALIIFIVWRGSRRGGLLTNMRALAAIFLGFASIVVPALAYFAAHGALKSFLDAVLRYNFAYSAASLESRLRALGDGLRILSKSGISITSVSAWICGVIYLYQRDDGDQARLGIIQLALIAFPIELAAASISGRSYPHYYMACLPVFAVLTGFFAHRFISGCFLCDSGAAAGGDNHGIRVRSFMLLALLLPVSAMPLAVLLHQAGAAENSRVARTKRAAVEYIERVTSSGDRVLIWGAEPSLNFLSRRESPSKYSFQYPLYTRGYQSAALVKGFLDELAAYEPALIIDTSPANALIPPIDPSARARWASPSFNYGMLPEMAAVFEFIASRYSCHGRIGPDGWPVYARRNAARFGG